MTSSFRNAKRKQLERKTLSITSETILFETIAAADRAYKILQKMIDVTIDCNAITYNKTDEETVKWLVEDYYCCVGARKRIYPYPVEAIAKTEGTTIYQYNELQIEQKYLPPADWEFIAKNSTGKIVDRIWWGYEDGRISIGMYIENFLAKN